MTSFWISISLVFLKLVVFYTHGCLNWDIWVHLGKPWKYLLSFPERRLSSRLIIAKQKSNNTVMRIMSYVLCISKKITQETYHIILPFCKCLECLFFLWVFFAYLLFYWCYLKYISDVRNEQLFSFTSTKVYIHTRHKMICFISKTTRWPRHEIMIIICKKILNPDFQ